jgi:two-component system response regulator AtoC
MLKEALIIDNQFPNKEALIKIASQYQLQINFIEKGKRSLTLLDEKKIDLLFFDVGEEDSFADELLIGLKKKGYDPYIVAMGDLTTLTRIVRTLKQGAHDYLIKPFSSHHIERIISKAILKKKELSISEIKNYEPVLIAKSPKMKELLVEASKIAKSQANIFIQGESGTGKEVFAKFIHTHSYRSGSPFIRVNCAAICENLIESEFFGHEKGSFTGALNTRIGRFELADKGTILLDEITEVPLSFQAKLLRTTQELEFERVGSALPRKVDVRIISTSNRIIQEAIKEKNFREDLYFRLNVIPLFLPPLRERKEDISSLADYFLEKASRENNKPQKRLSLMALEKMLYYSWPGNIRELRNICERLVVLSINDEIKPDELIFDSPFPKESQLSLFEEETIYPLEEVEEKYILKILKYFNYNKTRTAEALKINIRTLRNKLKNHSE